MKVVFVFGTRPEIIKCHSTYLELKQRGHEVSIYWTNQNFDPTLSDVIFHEFKYELDDFTRDNEHADYFLVQGDTWSVLEGAMMGKSKKTRLGHIEAGIRSYDERMIEEKIRVLVDRFSDFHFAPTQIAVKNIKKELGVSAHLTGNTVYDVMLDEVRGEPKYITVTLHRPETVDHKHTLKGTLDGITMVSSYYNLPIKFFCHPRTQDRMKALGVQPSFKVHPSISRKQFLEIMKQSRLVITDSGGVQEESAILHVPCVTARISTERPETVDAGLNAIGGNSLGSIFDAARKIVRRVESGEYDKTPLYGDGTAGKKIVDVLEESL